MGPGLPLFPLSGPGRGTLRRASINTVLGLFTAFATLTPAAHADTSLFIHSGPDCSLTAACSQAGQFGILTLANAVFQNSSDTLNGAIGFDIGSTFSPSSGTISGPVDFSDPLVTTSGGYLVPSGSVINNTTITGGTAYNPTLVAQADAEWLDISTYWAGQTGMALPANFGKGNNTLGVVGGGVQVYTAGYSVNSNQAITIVGGVNDLVVINVPAAYTFDIGAAINLSGGITADQVLINILGTSNNVLHISANGAAINADFVVANGNYSVNSASVDGRVAGGTGAVQWNSGGSETAPPDVPSGSSAAPEPSTYVLLGIGLLGLGYFSRRHTGVAEAVDRQRAAAQPRANRCQGQAGEAMSNIPI
jgi:hypothetical protein